jgi:Spy/CpxP family protein refolding chaperone
MRRLGKGLLVLGLVVVLASPVLAQGRRGGRGFGNPGGLLTNKSVQTELKLTDEQVKKIDALVKEVTDKHKDARDEANKIEDMMERFQKLGEIMREEMAEVQKGTASVLTPEQEKRYKQISLQQRFNAGGGFGGRGGRGGGGIAVFNDPEIAKALKLTDEQKEKIKTLAEDFGNDIRDVFQNAQGEERQTKMRELRKDYQDKVEALLTPDQKNEWKEMLGKPFTVQYPDRGGRGKKKDM